MFDRLERLIGKENLNKLHAKTVAVIGVGGVGGLIGPESDRLRFARNGALVRIGLGGGDLAGTGLIGKRRDGLALHCAGGNLATGNGDGGTGHFIRIGAVGQLGGRRAGPGAGR